MDNPVKPEEPMGPTILTEGLSNSENVACPKEPEASGAVRQWIFNIFPLSHRPCGLKNSMIYFSMHKLNCTMAFQGYVCLPSAEFKCAVRFFCVDTTLRFVDDSVCKPSQL